MNWLFCTRLVYSPVSKLFVFPCGPTLNFWPHALIGSGYKQELKLLLTELVVKFFAEIGNNFSFGLIHINVGFQIPEGNHFVIMVGQILKIFPK